MKMCSMWDSTVRLDRKSRSAISRLTRPSATRTAISFSRRVSGFASGSSAGPGGAAEYGLDGGRVALGHRERLRQRQRQAAPEQLGEPLLAEFGPRGVRRALPDLGVGGPHQHRRGQQRPQRVARAVQHGGELELGLRHPADREQVERHRDRVQVVDRLLQPQADQHVLDRRGRVAGEPPGGAADPQRGAPRPLLADFVAAPQALLAEPDRPVDLAGQQADRREPGVGDERERVAEPDPLVDGQRRLVPGLRGRQVTGVEGGHGEGVGDVRAQRLVAVRGGRRGASSSSGPPTARSPCCTARTPARTTPGRSRATPG